MSELEFDYGDFEQNKAREANKNNLVKFEMRSRPDKEATEREGRPMFKMVEYVDIRIPGKKINHICAPARQDHVDLYPEHYRRFKERIKEPEEGTPLAEWPPLGADTVDMLAFSNIKTVEQLAGMSDSVASGIMGGNGFKSKAIAFLEYTKETKKVTDAAALEQKNAELQEQIDVLMAKFEALEGDTNASAEGDGAEATVSTPKKVAKKTTKKVSAIDSALKK